MPPSQLAVVSLRQSCRFSDDFVSIVERSFTSFIRGRTLADLDSPRFFDCWIYRLVERLAQQFN